MPGDVEELVVTFLAPILKRVLVEQVDVFGNLRLTKHLFVLLCGGSNHACHQRGRRRQVIGSERQAFCVEVIDGQVAVGMNDYRACAFFDRGGVDPVAETFLNNDRVAEIAFGLRKQVTNGHRLARARHAEQNRVLGRLVVRRAGERLDADEIVVRAVVNRLGARQVSGEGARHWQHVRKEAMFRI